LSVLLSEAIHGPNGTPEAGVKEVFGFGSFFSYFCIDYSPLISQFILKAKDGLLLGFGEGLLFRSVLEVIFPSLFDI
jgi:hypothetical protein